MLLQFLVNRVCAFNPGFHAGRNAFPAQFRFHRAAHAFEVLFVGCALGFDGLGNVCPGVGVKVLEGEVFKFAAHLSHSEAVGDGRVDFERLAGDPFPSLRAETAQRAHIVDTVSQFDDDDADVIGHRQQHLAIILCLPFFGGEEVNFAEFGDTIDAPGDFIAEVFLDVRDRYGGVFHNVMQQSGFNADDIHTHADQNAGDGERVDEVGFARHAELACVELSGEFPRFADGGEVVFGPRQGCGAEQFFKRDIGFRGRGGDRQGQFSSGHWGHNSILGRPPLGRPP